MIRSSMSLTSTDMKLSMYHSDLNHFTSSYDICDISFFTSRVVPFFELYRRTFWVPPERRRKLNSKT